MRLNTYPELGLWLLLSLAACSPDSPPGGSGGSDGLGGSNSPMGGSSAGPAGSSGTPSMGGASGGSPNVAGMSNGGSSASGAVSGSGGSGAGNSGSGNGGETAKGGSGPSAGSSAGGASSGGNSGSGGASMGGMGTAGTAGGTAAPKSGMPVPPGPSDVAKPNGTPGDIRVLNWAGFKAAISYSFDDSNSTQIQRYQALNDLGVRFTFYMWTGKTEASNSIWATAVADGHEIGNHTQSHSSNGTTEDINAATAFIKQRYGVDTYTMAAPNGAGVYTNLARPLFMINRGVANNLIAPNDNTDPWTLPSYIPPTGASASQFNSQVDSARSQGRWRTMCLHGFQGGNDGAYQPVPFDAFVQSVQYAKSLGDVWIDSIVNVGAYWLGQKAFSQATTLTTGADKTWTWTLPDHFPPGRYLRVEVEGGTLTQNGQALSWDGHGYYEIALDAESVTLSP